MKKVFTIICVAILSQFVLFAQEKIDTVKYFWFMDIPQDLSSTYVTVAEGTFLEGENMTMEAQKLPSFAIRWQPVLDALVGSEMGLEIGTIDSTIIINVVLDSLDRAESHYLPIIGQTVFLYLEIDVLYKGVWYKTDSSFYFMNGKAAFMNIPISNNFLSFCNSIGIDVSQGVSFAYVNKDPISLIDSWDKVGISWVKTDSVINLHLEHFSRFGGGGKTLATDVKDEADDLQDFSLGQNYPNPFNPATKISYTLPLDGFVSLKIYNTIGAEVKTLASGFKKAGSYEIMFDGSQINSGVYFYSLRFNNSIQSRKMILIK